MRRKGKGKHYLKKIIITLIIIILLAGLAFLINHYFFADEPDSGDFSLDTLFLKISLIEGGSVEKYIQIENTAYTENHFSFEIKEIDNLVSLEEPETDLNAEEKYSLKLLIDSAEAEAGIYLGQVIISSDSGVKKIPIILEIQTANIYFDSNTNMYPAGDAYPGKRLNTEIKIFDLARIGKSNVEFTYCIKDFEGRTVISESEDLVVDDKLTFTKSSELSKNLRLGNYVLGVTTTYEDSVGTSSIFFKVVKASSVSSGFDFIGLDSNIVIIIIIVFGFLFLIFLIFFVYSVFYRDRLFIELQNQYKRELTNQRVSIQGKAVKDSQKLKTPAEKKVYRKEVAKVKKKRIKAIREIHKQRVRRFHKIKGKKIKGNLKQQLNKWKNQGYDTNILEKRYKLPKVDNIKKKVAKWKKQGYDTSVLEKKLK